MCDGSLNVYKKFIEGEKNSDLRIWSNIVKNSRFVYGDKTIYKGMLKKGKNILKKNVPSYKKDEALNIVPQLDIIIPGEIIKLYSAGKKVALGLQINSLIEWFYSIMHRLDGVIKPQFKDLNNDLTHLKDRTAARLFKEIILERKLKKQIMLLIRLSRRLKKRLLEIKK